MDLKVGNSNFQGGSGGGGTFYMGRQDQPKDQSDDDEDDAPEQENDSFKRAAPGDRDSFHLPVSHRSSLTLTTSERRSPEEDLSGLNHELAGKVRYITLALFRMERDLENRRHAEIGDVVVGD